MALRSILLFFMPGGLVFIAMLALILNGVWARWLPLVGDLFPAAVLGIGVVLGWRFHRSRLVFALLLLALADRALIYGASFRGASGWGGVIHDSVALLLPVNLVLLFFARERGIATGRGLCRLFLLLLQPAVIAALCLRDLPACQRLLHYRLLELPAYFERLPSQPALIAFMVAFLIFIVAYLRNRGPIENGFLWGLVAVYFGLTTVEAGPMSTTYLTTAGLILVIAVLEAAYAMAFRDELTGIPARRALNEQLLRVGRRYVVAMLDIDFFKKFNDRYGHDIGDQVLRMVAHVIAKVEGGGRGYRYGGEEFTVVFDGKSLDEALPYLEKLRHEVETAGFILRGPKRSKSKPKNKKAAGGGNRVSVTISIGAAEKNKLNLTPEQVIKAADKALYRAKEGGRNRVATS